MGGDASSQPNTDVFSPKGLSRTIGTKSGGWFGPVLRGCQTMFPNGFGTTCELSLVNRGLANQVLLKHGDWAINNMSQWCGMALASFCHVLQEHDDNQCSLYRDNRSDLLFPANLCGSACRIALFITAEECGGGLRTATPIVRKKRM